MFEGGFEEGDVAGSALAGVDEYIRSFFADEVGVCACTRLSRCTWDARRGGLPCKVNFPGFCRSSGSACGRISGAIAYLAEDAHYAVAQLFRMVSLYP